MEYGKTNILNKVFTKNTLNKWISLEKSDIYAITIKRFVKDAEGKTNKELISDIYTKMKTDYRNEYYYKNTLLNKLLIGKHSVNTTSALTEVNINKSKADFVLINGKAVVYEIKTELDNLDRLECQIMDYYKAFNHVAVLTYEKNLKNVENIINNLNLPVGLYVLRRTGKIGTVFDPKPYMDALDFNVMFNILRKSEYEQLVLNFFGNLPVTTQFKYYSECKEMLSSIDLALFYNSFTKILKNRCIIEKEVLDRVPYELRFLVYFNKMKEESYKNLFNFLKEERGEG